MQTTMLNASELKPGAIINHRLIGKVRVTNIEPSRTNSEILCFAFDNESGYDFTGECHLAQYFELIGWSPEYFPNFSEIPGEVELIAECAKYTDEQLKEIIQLETEDFIIRAKSTTRQQDLVVIKELWKGI